MSTVERFALDLPATIKTGNYTFLTDDSGTEVQFESAAGLTGTLPAVVTAGNGYNLLIRNIGSASLTIASNGSELIDGSTSNLTLATDEFRWLRCDGSEWKSVAHEVNEGSSYDFSFVAGFDDTMVLENIVVQTYGEVVIARSLTIEGAVGYIDTVATGSTVEVDVLKNGVSIYTTKPSFAVSTNAMTDQTPTTTSLASGDRLTFRVTQIGSTIAGQGLRFTLKTRLA